MIVLCSTVGRGYSLFSENGRYAIMPARCTHAQNDALYRAAWLFGDE